MSIAAVPHSGYTILPGPSEPPAEQVRRWIETPVQFWEECAGTYGPNIQLNLGSLGPVVLLSEPAIVKALLSLSPDRFECRHYNEHYRHVMGNESVLVQDGETHRRMRRLLAPVFRREAMAEKLASMETAAEAMTACWPVDEPFQPRPDLHELTFGIMIDVVLGGPSSPAAEALRVAYRECVARQTGSWGPWRNFSRLQPEMRRQLAPEIEHRRACPHEAGALSRFAAAVESDGRFAPVTQAEDHVFTMLVAGVDTTAIALTWALHWLALYPESADRARAEVNGRDARELLQLPWLQAIWNETLRMYPIVPTPSGRKLIADTTLAGMNFPAGFTLLPCTHLIHHREGLFPDHGRFAPQRFLERRYAPSEFLPFGGGARTCVGEVLSECEFKIAIAAILRRFRIEALAPEVLKPVRHGTLLAPPDGFRIVPRSVANEKH